jgi:S1-C subfamily serine protease
VLFDDADADPTLSHRDDDPLDAYSSAVIRVVDRLGPTVVKLETRRNSARRAGTGSGVVVATDGLVLTNSHVVEGSAQIDVTATEGRGLGARLLGADPDTDLALVRRAFVGIGAQQIAIPCWLQIAAALTQASVVMASAIEPSGPADFAGVRTGDILHSVNDTSITGADDLVRVLTWDRSDEALNSICCAVVTISQLLLFPPNVRDVDHSASPTGAAPRIRPRNSANHCRPNRMITAPP